MKIYTKRGDAGSTDLPGAGRVRKDSLRVACCGALDECNAFVGQARALSLQPDVDFDLDCVQRLLLTAGADVAAPSARFATARIVDADVAFLEEAIDRYDAELTPLTNLIVPGGTPAAAALHVARAVCRRAERIATSLAASESVNASALAYLNRLSDFLFVVARIVNERAGQQSEIWARGGGA